MIKANHTYIHVILIAIAWFLLDAGGPDTLISPIRAQSQSNPQQKSGKDQVENPHWHPDRCQSCHKNQAPPQGIALKDVDTLCLGCHDGRKASAETHPTGVEMNPEDFQQPAGWPLLKGKLSCQTCHNPVQACRKGISRPMSNPDFLRSPTIKPDDFCAHCHSRNRFSRYIPHIMLRQSNELIQLPARNEIDEDTCLFCHLEVPNRNAMQYTGNAKLRMEEIKLCKICHAKHRSYYKPGHLGQKISDKIYAFMTARELLGPNVKAGISYLKRLQRDKAKPTMIRADAQGKITCTTCHNPHQEGVFPPKSLLAYQAIWIVGPGRISSPSIDQNMCFQCHEQ